MAEEGTMDTATEGSPSMVTVNNPTVALADPSTNENNNHVSFGANDESSSAVVQTENLSPPSSESSSSSISLSVSNPTEDVMTTENQNVVVEESKEHGTTVKNESVKEESVPNRDTFAQESTTMSSAVPVVEVPFSSSYPLSNDQLEATTDEDTNGNTSLPVDAITVAVPFDNGTTESTDNIIPNPNDHHDDHPDDHPDPVEKTVIEGEEGTDVLPMMVTNDNNNNSVEILSVPEAPSSSVEITHTEPQESELPKTDTVVSESSTVVEHHQQQQQQHEDGTITGPALTHNEEDNAVLPESGTAEEESKVSEEHVQQQQQQSFSNPASIVVHEQPVLQVETNEEVDETTTNVIVPDSGPYEVPSTHTVEHSGVDSATVDQQPHVPQESTTVNKEENMETIDKVPDEAPLIHYPTPEAIAIPENEEAATLFPVPPVVESVPTENEYTSSTYEDDFDAQDANDQHKEKEEYKEKEEDTGFQEEELLDSHRENNYANHPPSSTDETKTFMEEDVMDEGNKSTYEDDFEQHPQQSQQHTASTSSPSKSIVPKSPKASSTTPKTTKGTASSSRRSVSPTHKSPRPPVSPGNGRSSSMEHPSSPLHPQHDANGEPSSAFVERRTQATAAYQAWVAKKEQQEKAEKEKKMKEEQHLRELIAASDARKAEMLAERRKKRGIGQSMDGSHHPSHSHHSTRSTDPQAIAKRIEANPLQRKKLPEKLARPVTTTPGTNPTDPNNLVPPPSTATPIYYNPYTPVPFLPFGMLPIAVDPSNTTNGVPNVTLDLQQLTTLLPPGYLPFTAPGQPPMTAPSPSATSPRTIKAGMDAVSTHHTERRRRSVSRPTPLTTNQPPQPQPMLGMDPRLFPEGLPPTMLIPPNLMFPMGFNGLPMYPGLSFPPPTGNETNTKESKTRTPRTAPAKGRRTSPHQSTNKNVFELNGVLEDGDDAFVKDNMNPKSSKRKSKPTWDNYFASAGSLSGGVQGTVLDEDLAMSTLKNPNSATRRSHSPNHNHSTDGELDEEGKPKLLPVGSGTRVTSKRPQYDVLLDRVSMVDTLKQVVGPETAADMLGGTNNITNDFTGVRATTTSPRQRGLSSPLRNNVSSSGKRTGSRSTSRARTSDQKSRPKPVNNYQNQVLQVATDFANAGQRIEKQNIARAAAESAAPFDVTTPVKHSGSIIGSASQRAQSPKEMVERALAAAQAATARSMQSALMMHTSPTPLGVSMSPANVMGSPFLPMVPLSPTAQALLAGGMLSQNLAQAINAALSPKMGTSASTTNGPVSETDSTVATSPTAQLRGASVVDSGLHPTSPPPVMEEINAGKSSSGESEKHDSTTHSESNEDGLNGVPPLVKPTPVRKSSFVRSDDSTNPLVHGVTNDNGSTLSVTVYPTINEEIGIQASHNHDQAEEQVYHVPVQGSIDQESMSSTVVYPEDGTVISTNTVEDGAEGHQIESGTDRQENEQPEMVTSAESTIPEKVHTVTIPSIENSGNAHEESSLMTHETEQGYTLHVAGVEQGDTDRPHSTVVVTPSRRLPQPEIIDENGIPIPSPPVNNSLSTVEKTQTDSAPSIEVEGTVNLETNTDDKSIQSLLSPPIPSSSESVAVRTSGGSHSPRPRGASSPRHNHIVIPPKPSPPQPPAVEAPPFDDGDIFTLHRKQLEEFAHAHAPQMLQTLDTAWQKFGTSLEGVGKLWDACERRYPNLTLEFRGVAIELERSRTLAREAWSLYASQLQMYEESLNEYESAIKEKENADFNRMMEQAKSDGGPLYLPRWDTVYATLVSSYVEPNAVLVDSNGQVMGSAPPEGETIPEGTMILALTPSTPSILSLGSAVRRLLDLSPRDIALLQYVRKPNRSLVVAYGALCVLLDIPTTWPDALRVISDELLVDKLIYLSGLPLTEGRVISSLEPQAFAMQVAASEGQTYTKQRLSMSPGGNSTHVSTLNPHSPAVGRPRGVPASLHTYPLQITGKQISLARKLLNKRPDIRAEVRYMAVSVVARPLPPHHNSSAPPPPQYSGPPFTMACNALVALVEWLCAFTLHHTEAQIQADPQTRELWQSQLNARSNRSSTRPSGAQSTELGLSSASFPDDGR